MCGVSGERLNKMLKSLARSKRHPEASVVKAYALNEAIDHLRALNTNSVLDLNEGRALNVAAVPDPAERNKPLARRVKALGKPRTVSVPSDDRLKLFEYWRGNDPAVRALVERFEQDTDSKFTSLAQLADWAADTVDGELSEQERAIARGPCSTAVAYERVLVNGTLFRTESAEAKLVTCNSGARVAYINEQDELRHRFGFIQYIIEHQAYERKTAPRELLLKGAWFADLERHSNGLPRVRKHAGDAFVNNNFPFARVKDLDPVNIVYWSSASLPANEFFVITFNVDGEHWEDD
jgi:hypothetical protein